MFFLKYIHDARARLYATYLLLFVIYSVYSFSCHQKKGSRQIERSFYYWRSVLKLSGFEKQQLDSLAIKTLYIKFFDVVWDETQQQASPVAKLLIDEVSLASLRQDGTNSFFFNVIPVIFITNECMQKIDSAQIQTLAENINTLTTRLIQSYSFNNIPELQFDCDWTTVTKDKYFLLLSKTKKIWKNTAIPISATIRLHQIKFMSKTGTPPVDKGLLMCYNMGNLKNVATHNSIIETKELKKYIGNISTYSLPLDVALPLFDWKVLYRNGTYAGLIQHLPTGIFTTAFATIEGNRYKIIKDTLLQGYTLKKGDEIRDEQSNYSEIMDVGCEVGKRLKNSPLRVVLYHIDSLLLSKYSIHELESIYNSLR